MTTLELKRLEMKYGREPEPEHEMDRLVVPGMTVVQVIRQSMKETVRHEA